MSDKYIRDPGSQAIVRNDIQAYKSYIAKRNEVLKIESLNTDVNNIKNELSDIKLLLQTLIDGKNNG